MPTLRRLSGKCLCGGVAVSFETDKDNFDVCHCGMCRKWGGGPAMTVDGGKNISLTGEENITTYSSSEWADRGFCKQCGTHLFYRLKGSDYCNFTVGLLDGTENLNFHMQIFIDLKPANYDFANKTKTMTGAEVFAKFGPPPEG